MKCAHSLQSKADCKGYLWHKGAADLAWREQLNALIKVLPPAQLSLPRPEFTIGLSNLRTTSFDSKSPFFVNPFHLKLGEGGGWYG